MIEQMAKPAIQTSVRISPENYELCKKNRIQFSDAIRQGIVLILAEKGILEYDQTLKIMQKLRKYQDKMKDGT